MQTDFIALYRGQTVAEARLVAITAEPEIVSRFLREMVGERNPSDAEGHADLPTDREPLRLVPDGGE